MFSTFSFGAIFQRFILWIIDVMLEYFIKWFTAKLFKKNLEKVLNRIVVVHGGEPDFLNFVFKIGRNYDSAFTLPEHSENGLLIERGVDQFLDTFPYSFFQGSWTKL